jgi:hypothetical protein
MRERRITQKPLEIGENVRDEALPTWIIARRGLGKESEKITRLLDGFGPPGRGERQEHLFQNVLASFKRRLVGLNADAQPAQLRRFLSRYAAVLVKINRLIRHNVGSACRRSNGARPKSAASSD